MFTRELLVNRETGLHAEVAHQLVKIAKSTECLIYLSTLDGRAANLQKPLEVLGLAIKPGDTVIAIAKTPDTSVAEQLFSQLASALG